MECLAEYIIMYMSYSTAILTLSSHAYCVNLPATSCLPNMFISRITFALAEMQKSNRLWTELHSINPCNKDCNKSRCPVNAYIRSNQYTICMDVRRWIAVFSFVAFFFLVLYRSVLKHDQRTFWEKNTQMNLVTNVAFSQHDKLTKNKNKTHLNANNSTRCRKRIAPKITFKVIQGRWQWRCSN